MGHVSKRKLKEHCLDDIRNKDMNAVLTEPEQSSLLILIRMAT